jgi:hypothetical protein
MWPIKTFYRTLILFFLLLPIYLMAAIQPVHYGIRMVADQATIEKGTAQLMDSLLAAHPQLSGRLTVQGYTHAHIAADRTLDFYVLLFLCFVLGIIRLLDPRYFYNLWRAFTNPTLSNRQLKEQIQGAGFSNFMMNVFFTIAAGTYLYYLVKLLTPDRSRSISSFLLIVLLIAGTMLIYAAKYVAVRFSGWAFRVEGVTDHYLFNVFLMNKILAIILIPFIVIMAFADPVWGHPIIVVSLIACLFLFVNRYVRSWQVFGSFFQYSKFHFFTYLCASELLPLAVLIKLLIRGLLF